MAAGRANPLNCWRVRNLLGMSKVSYAMNIEVRWVEVFMVEHELDVREFVNRYMWVV
jgi:hypothetical protein